MKPSYQNLLDALLDSWDRNNTILVNLLRIIPEAGMTARGAGGSPTVAGMLTHIHNVRMVFVKEDAPEFAPTFVEPGRDDEWKGEPDRERMAQLLNESARVVRDAVKGRLEAGRNMDLHYDHPILMLQHMIWHEGYHHGQIKLALKAAGLPLDNKVAGPGTWRVWMNKTG